jgi:hypothetical protein
MEPTKPVFAAGALLCFALLLTILTVPRPVFAQVPVLEIRLTGDESAIYLVSDIEWIGFEGAETLVVVTPSGSDYYPASSIIRIEFLWETSAVEDPKDAARLVKAIHLFQNLPNPFSPQTRIGFDLPLAGEVELGIYSPEGRLVRTLVTGKREAGRHEVYWDGRNDSERKVSSGVYFYQLKAPGIEESRRMILLP